MSIAKTTDLHVLIQITQDQNVRGKSCLKCLNQINDDKVTVRYMNRKTIQAFEKDNPLKNARPLYSG